MSVPEQARLHHHHHHYHRGPVGITFTGEPIGHGMLDYDYLIEAVRLDDRGINKIVEQS